MNKKTKKGGDGGYVKKGDAVYEPYDCKDEEGLSNKDYGIALIVLIIVTTLALTGLFSILSWIQQEEDTTITQEEKKDVESYLASQKINQLEYTLAKHICTENKGKMETFFGSNREMYCTVKDETYHWQDGNWELTNSETKYLK